MTKKTILITLMALSSVTATYAGNSIDAKIGAGSIEQKNIENEKPLLWGFDAAIAFNLELDKLLAISPEIGFLNVSNTGSFMGADWNSHTYLFPLTLNAKLFLPMGDADMGEKPLLQPYITVGGGYVFGENHFEYGPMHQKVGLNGFTYQALLGAAITLDPTSAVQILLEGGYRGFSLKPDVDNPETEDSKGFIARVGIRYSLAGATSY